MEIYFLDSKSVYNKKEISDKEIPNNVIKVGGLGDYFKYHTILEVPNKRFMLKDLVGLTKLYNTEFAIYTCEDKLYVKKGNKPDLQHGKAGSVTIKKSEQMLIHVHPTYHSVRDHLNVDLQVNSGQVEAIIDYDYNIIVYQNNKVFNKKDAEGIYQTLDIHDVHWPSFLEKNAGYNIEVYI